jgi:hypothetical protein
LAKLEIKVSAERAAPHKGCLIMNTSVIVIHETNHRYDYESVKDWFDNSDFEACEAADLFEAIDKMSDFTNRGCPDVYLVRVRPGSQQDKMIREFEPANFGYTEVPIAVLSDTRNADEKKTFNFGSVRGLKANLDSPTAGPV